MQTQPWKKYHRRISSILFGLLTVTVLTLPSESFAMPSGPKGGPLAATFFSSALSLTESQKKEIRGIIKEHSDEMKAARAAMKASRAEFFTYLKSGGADAGKIDRLTTNSATALKNFEALAATTFIQAYALLTPTQRQELAGLSLPEQRKREGMRRPWR